MLHMFVCFPICAGHSVMPLLGRDGSRLHWLASAGWMQRLFSPLVPAPASRQFTEEFVDAFLTKVVDAIDYAKFPFSLAPMEVDFSLPRLLCAARWSEIVHACVLDPEAVITSFWVWNSKLLIMCPPTWSCKKYIPSIEI